MVLQGISPCPKLRVPTLKEVEHVHQHACNFFCVSSIGWIGCGAGNEHATSN